MAVTDRFVVGTGRCGSTLLSLLLAEHREVVSLHELFTGLDWGRRFAPGPVTGAELAELITAEQPVTTEVMKRGHVTDEIQYPFGAPQARHALGDPVPWLLVSMLPRLTDDPDPWFDDLQAWAAARPTTTLTEHYRALFAWLTERAGGTVWVERSGSSIDYLGGLLDTFPGARFVHLHRDGPEAALSIRAHPFFRLGVAFFLGLVPDGDPDEVITRIVEDPPPCWAVGRYWTDQLLRGFHDVPRLDADQWLDVAFEDLVADPVPVLERIAAFFELPDDPGFAPRAAERVRGLPPPRVDALDDAERVELLAACRPGQLLLGRDAG